MNRPQVPGGNPVAGMGASPGNRLQQTANRADINGPGGSGAAIGNTAIRQGMIEAKTAQNTAEHRFATALHQQAADSIDVVGPPGTDGVRRALFQFKNQIKQEQIGVGSPSNQLAAAGADAAGGLLRP